MPNWALPAIVAALVTALIAASAVVVVQTNQLGAVREDRDELAREVAALQAQVERLEERLAEAEARDGVGDGLLDGLLDGGDLGGLLDGLLGGGDLGGLLDGATGIGTGGQGEACFTPAAGGVAGPNGDLGGRLEGLLGDGAGDLGGLFDGLLGDEGGDLGELLGDDAGDPDEETGGDALDLDDLVQTTADEVAELRELAWQEDVEVEFLDDAATRERIDELVLQDLDPEEVDADERLLVALRVIPAGTDLVEMQVGLLGDQAAGFYVPETSELVVRVPDDGQLGATDRITLAHELDHALTDQTLGLPDRTGPSYEDDPDRSFAALAVVEGDATIVMNQWALTHLTLDEQLAMATDLRGAEAQQALGEFPHLLQRQLLAPYTDGAEWVCQQLLEGGWEAVDAAYADPPTTSAEILWGAAVDPATTATTSAPTGFDEMRTTTFGAASLLWLMEAPGDDPSLALDDPEERARAWAGGAVSVYADGDRSAVGLALVDGGDGSAPLCDSVDAWYSAASDGERSTAEGGAVVFDGGEQAAVLTCDGDDVVLGIAEDLETATEVLGG